MLPNIDPRQILSVGHKTDYFGPCANNKNRVEKGCDYTGDEHYDTRFWAFAPPDAWVEHLPPDKRFIMICERCYTLANQISRGIREAEKQAKTKDEVIDAIIRGE